MIDTSQDLGPTDLVIEGTGVILDLERLDFAGDIPMIGVPDSIRYERDPVKSRDLYLDWIEARALRGEHPIISATSLTVEEEAWKVRTLLIASGLELSEGRIIPAQRPLPCDLDVELATWTGLPLSSRLAHRRGGAHLHGVKIGVRPLHAREAHDWVRRGGSLNIYRDYPARFRTNLVEARRLLDLYGWRLGHQKERWWIYEVGGPIEAQLARWLDEVSRSQDKPDLAARARQICSTAFDEAESEAEAQPEPKKRRAS